VDQQLMASCNCRRMYLVDTPRKSATSCKLNTRFAGVIVVACPSSISVKIQHVPYWWNDLICNFSLHKVLPAGRSSIAHEAV